MSTLTEVRNALTTLIANVEGAGEVHPWERFGKSEAFFRAAYGWQDDLGTKQVRGWFIRRIRTVEKTISIGRVLNVHTWRVPGFMTLNDSGSEIEFDELIEAIRAAYRRDESLGGLLLPGPLDEVTGFQLVDSKPVMFAGVLCHNATLQLTTHSLLNDGE